MTAGAHQRGMTFFGLMLGLIVMFALASVALRLLPHYVDDHTIESVVRSVVEADLEDMSTREIRQRIDKRLEINSVRDFDMRENLAIDRRKGALVVDLAYEVREDLFYNIDAVLSFEQHFERVID